MPQVRIDQDVWELGAKVADACGLGSPRIAIEAVMRLNAEYYVQRMTRPCAEPVAPPASAPLSAQEGLTSLISDL